MEQSCIVLVLSTDSHRRCCHHTSEQPIEPNLADELLDVGRQPEGHVAHAYQVSQLRTALPFLVLKEHIFNFFKVYIHLHCLRTLGQSQLSVNEVDLTRSFTERELTEACVLALVEHVREE